MSNFIPMVSSSPPPLEDGGGFNDWGDDDDDFGNFTSATDGEDSFQPFTDDYNDEDQWSNTQGNNQPKNRIENFADFGNFPVSPEDMLNDSEKTLNNDDCVMTKPIIQASSNLQQEESKGPGLELDLQKPHIGSHGTSDHNSHAATNSEHDGNLVRDDSKQNGKNFGKSHSENNIDSISSMSAGDSGLCSTDISPVPRSDEIYDPCDKSQGSDFDDFGDFNSDCSVGKENSVHQNEVQESVIQNSNTCDMEETDREQKVTTPTEFDNEITCDPAVSDVLTNDKQIELSNVGALPNIDDSATPSDSLSDVSTDGVSSPVGSIEMNNEDNLSSQTNKLSPIHLELRVTDQTLSDVHGRK